MVMFKFSHQTVPPIESMGSPNQTPDFAKIANDAMADAVAKYPDRFVAGVAVLP